MIVLFQTINLIIANLEYYAYGSMLEYTGFAQEKNLHTNVKYDRNKDTFTLSTAPILWIAYNYFILIK